MAVTTNHYDLVVLGQDVAGLVAAALVARRNKRVLVMPHGSADGSVRLGGLVLPLDTAPVVHMGTGAVQRVFQELGLWQQIRRDHGLVEGLVHWVLPQQRLDLQPPDGRFAEETAREWPDDPVAEAWSLRDRWTHATDEVLDQLLTSDNALVADGFWSRRFLSRVASQLPGRDVDELQPLPAEHPLRAAARAVEPWLQHLTPAQLGKAASLRLAGLWAKGPGDVPRGLPHIRKALLQRIELHSGEVKPDLRVAELQLMAARLALIAGRLDGQGLNEGDREQMAALGRRFGDVAAEAEAQGAREVERAREVATDTAGLASAVILAITAGSLALAVVVSALLSRRLARSVTTLLDATKRMSSGDLDVRTTLGGNDEFSALARGFTRMSADLNRNIEQRKRESAKAKQLAREAGVAYVTTGVIHNIGNALTSVNISLELLQSSGVGERLARVARVGSMLAEHQDELDHFLLHDPKGSRVAQYLVALAPELERDAEGFEDELGRVRERVDHLVHILRAYQAHGMATLDYEDARVDELLEFAVDVALSSGRQTRYRVVCKVDGLSVIRIDKHRTLQILINLVRNAADAIDQSRRSDGEIVVAAHPVESTMVGFAVTDNGVGIESEHFDQIFLHGFTTKPANTGSGFGLHASANAAAEMGGRLLAHSDGPDKGAHFVLEIPFKEALGDGVEDQDDARSPPDA
ncbi:MAG: HAMP domain-containing histidine kinase [Myxococcales bacterium]|nr:HAMP domain-containing histidine kinase [Myxococcales bacterium]